MYAPCGVSKCIHSLYKSTAIIDLDWVPSTLRTMTLKKRMLLVALAAAVFGIAAFAVMVAKDRTYVP
jgi:hypothetical protein